MKHIAQGVKISFVHLRKPGEVVRHNEPKGSPAIDFVMFGVVLFFNAILWVFGDLVPESRDLLVSSKFYAWRLG